MSNVSSPTREEMMLDPSNSKTVVAVLLLALAQTCLQLVVKPDGTLLLMCERKMDCNRFDPTLAEVNERLSTNLLASDQEF